MPVLVRHATTKAVERCLCTNENRDGIFARFELPAEVLGPYNPGWKLGALGKIQRGLKRYGSYQIKSLPGRRRRLVCVEQMPRGWWIISKVSNHQAPNAAFALSSPLLGRVTLPSFHMARTGVSVLSSRASFIVSIF